MKLHTMQFFNNFNSLRKSRYIYELALDGLTAQQ